jgi:hypothetical protein
MSQRIIRARLNSNGGQKRVETALKPLDTPAVRSTIIHAFEQAPLKLDSKSAKMIAEKMVKIAEKNWKKASSLP